MNKEMGMSAEMSWVNVSYIQDSSESKGIILSCAHLRNLYGVLT